jgi:hypothetical protein
VKTAKYEYVSEQVAAPPQLAHKTSASFFIIHKVIHFAVGKYQQGLQSPFYRIIMCGKALESRFSNDSIMSYY